MKLEKDLDFKNDIDESRKKHKHIEAKGGLADDRGEFELKYCFPCDMFYEVKKNGKL